MIGPAFHLLGPVGARNGDQEIRIGAPRLRTLLAALLVNANRTVTTAELADWIWGEQPPAEPRRALHTAVFRLRGKLGPDLGTRLRTMTDGYRLDAGPDELDLASFRALAAAGTDSPRETVGQLTAALALWSGDPLTGVLDQPAIRAQRAVLQEERLRVTERLIDARLEIGEHAQLIVELTALTRQYPLRERFWAQLMLALHRSDRQADALATYRRIADLLRDELGIDPGEEIQRVHRTVLAGELPPPVEEPPGWDRHWQLPLDVGDFIGRRYLGDAIAERLTASTTVPVVAITGPPGVGKTALAVRVGHRLRAEFPDGQWYVPLDGATAPRDPVDVLAELLGLCGVGPAAIPAGLEARAARLRSLLADRRVLILLDDAHNAQQVQPLLPGTPGSAVLVTSRNELSALSVLSGAQGSTLGVLEPAEAAELLSLTLGANRVERERAAAAEVARLCGYLPLALRIAAGHLAERPDQSIAAYAEDLRTGDRLSKLAIGDHPATAVAAAFASAYQVLAPEARRLFALLGVTAGPDLTVPAVAALLDAPNQVVARQLDTLVSANLLYRQANRYRMHDLIRLYAERRAAGEPDAGDAWQRLCAWYLRTADAALQRSYPPNIRLTPQQPSGGRFDDPGQAMAWLAAEEPNMVAIIVRAARTGPHDKAWQLTDILRVNFAMTQHVVAWRQAADAGLAAARISGDRGGEGAMWQSLGALYFVTGDNTAAIEMLGKARDRFAKIGFRPGVAAVLCTLGMAYNDQGDSVRAAEVLQRCVDDLRALGVTATLTVALNWLSNVYANLGDLRAALGYAAEAIEVTPGGPFRTLALYNRGIAHRLRGELSEAEADLTEAVRSPHQLLPLSYEMAWLYVDLDRLDEAGEYALRSVIQSRKRGLDWHEAAALNTLGAVALGRHDPAGAERHHRAAQAIAEEHGHRATTAEAVLGLAAVALRRRDLTGACRQGEQVLEVARELRHRILECRALLLLAEVDATAGRPSLAAQRLAAAGVIQDATGFRPATRRWADAG